MTTATGSSSRPEVRRPDLETLFSINADGSRNFIHPADVKGRWQLRKHAAFALLVVIYAALPWIEIGGHPSILIDIPGRAAYLFGATFTNRDFFLVFFLLTGIGFALFVLTSLFGRVWCGYACPQTVYLEGVFRKLERLIEGPREQRIRRNKGPWTREKLLRKTLKHSLFVLLSLAISHVFLAYFIPVRELLDVMRSPPAEHLTAFLWVMGITAVITFDMAWFREQTCLIVCPYGRLQSVLIDADTIIIGYDTKRGEPRGKRGQTPGDCIDCYRCVAVCPTGIDIRSGLQMECVGCANCIDACDEIMTHVGRKTGLIRYDSKNSFDGKPRRFWRPRVFLYLVLGILGLAVAGLATANRTSFEANALRSPGLPYTLIEEKIRNLFTLHIQNKTSEPQTYTIEPASDASSAAPEFVIAQREVRLEPLGDIKVPVFVTVARSAYAGPFQFSLAVTEASTQTQRRVEVLFRGP
ncbi:MAG: cytochrome c oxidase accessory protein CcoG [Planctomycetota bacterium]